MMYTVREGFWENWGDNYNGELLSYEEVEELAKAWDKPIDELMEQLEVFGEDEPSSTSLYRISYFDDQDNERSIILSGKSKEEVGILFAEICDDLEGGASGGLNYIDEIAVLTEEEADLVKRYNMADWSDKKALASDVCAVYEKHGCENLIDEELMAALQPEVTR